MVELKGEEIKNAVVSQLLKIAPECAVYKEAKTSPSYPHFFVHLIAVSDEEQRKNHHVLCYSFDIRYRTKSDSSTDLKLEQNLDAMALKLSAGLNIIDCGDVKIRCEDKRYEKQDGVLHYFFKVYMQTILVDTEADSVKQGKLGVEIELEVKR